MLIFFLSNLNLRIDIFKHYANICSVDRLIDFDQHITYQAIFFLFLVFHEVLCNFFLIIEFLNFFSGSRGLPLKGQCRYFDQGVQR